MLSINHIRRPIGLALLFLLLANLYGSFMIEPISAASTLTLKWTRYTGANSKTQCGPLVSDLTGDGKMEIVVAGAIVNSSGWTTDGSITVLDGATGNIVWKRGISDIPAIGIDPHTVFDLADINRDGVQEVIVYSMNGPIVLRGNDGSLYWRRMDVPGDANYGAVCDINADGFLEVFIDSGQGPYEGIDYITSLTYDGKVMNQTPCWHACWGGLSIGDTNFDGRFELYEGDRSIDYNPSGDPYKYGGWGLRAIDAHTLTPLWNDSSILCSSHSPILADVDKDGILDVIAANQGTSNGGLVVLNAADGSVVTTGGKYRKNLNLGLPAHSPMPVCDIDGDGNLEIIVCRDTNVKIWDLYDWKLDATLPLVCHEPPRVGDVTGDGQMDIIAVNASAKDIHVYSYDMSGNVYNEVANVTGLSGANSLSVLQDVDGDGLNELVVSSYSGNVYCYDTLAPAANPRPRSGLQFYSEYKRGVPEYLPSPGPQAPLISDPSPGDGATNITRGLSQLSFNLTDFQNDRVNYTVTTFPDIGSGGGINKVNGRYSIPTSNLSFSTTYAWTVTATDGQNSRSKTYTFTTIDLPLWWNTSWQYRKAVSIDSSKVSGDQTDFPVVIDIVDSGLTGKAQSDGDDFVFTDANQAPLSHEIEQYDAATGHLTVWVRVPFLSASTNTLLYMYYGNPTCGNQQDVNAVWDSSNRMVLHLDEKTGIHYDSTVNGNNGTPYNGVVQGVAGRIDGADTFDGVNDYVEVAHSTTISGFAQAFTASFWLRLDNVGKRQVILNKYNTGTNQKGWFIEYNPVDRPTRPFGFYASQDGATYKEWYAAFTPTAGTWYYIVVVWEANAIPKFYVNGVQVTTAGTSTIASIYNNVGVPLHIGRCTYNTARYLKGALDEIRVSNPARSAGWILTCYNNQKDPSTFYQVGIEESLQSEPFVSHPNPTNGAANVSLELTELSFNLTDYQNNLMNYTVTTTPDVGLSSQTNVPNSRYSVPITGLNGSTAYTWTVSMTDGTHPATTSFTFTTEPAGNKPPTQGTPLLISSGGTNTTNENLICYNQTTADRDHDPVTNVYNWIRNDVSINSLLMPFNTNSSLTATDYSGNGNNGSVVGATWLKSGIIGGAYSFDGIGNYISIPHSTSLDGGGSWNKLTVEFWINLGSASQNAKRVIAKRGSTSGTYSYQVGFQTANGRLYFDVWNPNAYEVEYTTLLSADTWYHVVCTYNSGQGSRIYINGTDINAVKVGSGSVSGNVAASSGQPLFIGCRYGTQDFFKGAIDEVRICGARALTPEQIIQDYTQSKDGLSTQSTLVSKELFAGEIWVCQVTPNDGNQDGLPQTSNPITMIAAPQPFNDVLFDSSFDMGNLRNVQFQSGDASGNRFYTGEQNHTTVSFPDKHWWFYFSMDNVSGKTVTVKFVNNEAVDFQDNNVTGNRWPFIEPVYSYDNNIWTRLPLTGVSFDRAAATYTMTITVPPTQSKVWLAPLPPHTIHKRDALFDEFKSSPYLNVTSLGTTPGGQLLKVATITDPAYADAGKFKSYVIGQQHAGELGSWNIEGLIRYLLSNDSTAAAIRRSYIFRIVPIVNVDGVYQGVSRYTPLRSGVQYDLNREWTKDVSAMQPEIRWIWQDLLAFKPDSFNDMHSTINTEVGSPKEALTYTWSTSDPAVIAFRAKITLGGYPETVTGVSGYACSVVHNSADLGNIKESVSWEDPCSELSTNPGVKLTVNDWMTWGAGWAKGNYLYFGNATGTLTVDATGNGTVTKNPDSPTYAYGTVVQLTATPGQGLVLSQWTGDLSGNANPAYVTITGNLSITAVFSKKQHTLNVTVSPPGIGTVQLNGTGPLFLDGDTVQLTAFPNDGCTFIGWSGDAAGTTNPTFILMDGNKSVTANFNQNLYTLTINIQGYGSVAKLPDQSDYTYGTSVQLTATPEPSYMFSNWSGDLSGDLNPASINMTGNRTVTAVFAWKQSNWWNTSWQYRRTITINHLSVNSNQTDFPVLIDLTDSGLTTKTQANGYDFVFTDANQIKLSHEIESYNSGTGHLTAWIKIPVLSSTADTVLYMYYGNPTCGNQQNVTAVWDSSNRMVLHLDEKTGIHYDSTVNGNNGTAYNGVIREVAGKIDGADTFDGVNDYVEVAHSNTISGFTQAFTASFWLRLDDASKRQAILNKYNTGANQKGWFIEYNPTDRPTKPFGFYASQDGATYKEWYASFTPTAGTWYYVTVVWEANTVPKFYVNGVQVATTGTSTIASIYNNVGVPLHIGRCTYNTARYLKGSLDEIRLSNPARSAGWILTCYNNQKDPSTFYQVGTEEPLEPPRYTLTVNVTGQGSVTKTPDQLTYANNTSVQLTATAAPGWTFTGWSGDLSGSVSPTNITMIGNKIVTATFTQNQYTITITVVGSGNATKNPDQATYTYGQTVTLTASPSVGYSFTGWSGDLTGIQNPVNITITGNKAVTATFEVAIEYTLTVNVVGSGSVTKTPDKMTYNQGTVVTLTAIPTLGYSFSGWSGDLSGSQNPNTITMNSNKSITATFTQDQYTLTITTVGNGTVTKNPVQATYTYGQTVTLTASQDLGWAFSGWSGDLSGSVNPASINMTGNRTVTATFTQNQYTLTVGVVGSGSVGKDPDKTTYTYGEVVTLNASANVGYVFTGWSGDLTGSQNPVNITITGNRTVTATFTVINYNDVAFDSSFDMGNLRNVQFQSGDSAGNRFYTGEQNHTTVSFSDKHWWFYFSMNNVAGKTVTISLVNNEAVDFSGSRWPEIEPVFSYDNVNWERVPLSGVTNNSAARSFTMTVSVPLGQSKIWLAPLPPYNIAKRDALFAEFASSPYLTVTPLGTTPGGQELKVATITDPAYSDAGKFKSYVIGQQHAGEVQGSWNAEGLIRFLLSDDPTAVAIRRSYIFKIVPIVNVDGVFQGVSRYTPLRSGVQYDLNRDWTTRAQQEIQWIWNDLLSFQPDSFNDMHSTINTEVGSPKELLTYTWNPSDPAVIAFRAKIKQGGFPETVSGTTPYACTVVHNSAALGNIEESVSWENPFDELSTIPGIKLTVNDWMTWGAGWAKGNYLYFGDAQATLTINTDGSGTVTKNPDQTTYAYGTIVTLTPNPQTDWVFSHWSGDLTGSTNPATINMTGDRSVTATFIQLLVDSEFSESTDSLALRTDGTGQDWYESRVQDQSLLFLDTSDIGGDTSKKAGFTASNVNPTGNAYLTQEFGSPQTGIFTVQWDIYVDSITTPYNPASNPYRAGFMLIGDNSNPTRPGPNSDDNERFAYMAFLKPGGGTSGTMDLVARDRDDPWATFTTIATGLNLKQWYTIKVICNIPADTYDVYVDGVLVKAGVSSRFAKTSVTHISFAQWNDGSGAFYVDNVFAPAVDRYRLAVTTVGNGAVDKYPAEATYAYGAAVQLTANPQVGWSFSEWSGALTGNTSPATITMDSDKTVTATFTQNTYTLTVSTDGSGSVNRNNSGPYHYGDTVELTAVPATGWSFDHWSGDLIGFTNPDTVTITDNKAVTATFTENPPNEYSLSINLIGNGGVTKYPDQATYSEGTTVTLNATPAVGWSFSGWSDDLSGSANPVDLLMDGNKVVNATFTQNNYTLTVSVIGSGSVVLNNTGPYHYGDTVQLTANPTVGWSFSGWSGNLSGSLSPATLTVDGDESVTATFTEDQYNLTVNVVGNGSVSKVPDQLTYTYGTAVQLNATATSGWVFTGWSGDLSGPANPAKITVAGDKTVTATFTQLLLTDSEFSNSTDSLDLRANGSGQDWFESRGAFPTGSEPTRLTLNTTDIGGDTSKKAQLANYGGTANSNAYLTQEFISNQTGTFSVSFDIYIDRIETTSTYPLANRTGHIYLGDDTVKTNAITGTSNERFVYFAFYDSTPNVGNDLEIRARTLSTQVYGTTSQWTQVATGLSYKTWYTIKLVVNVTAGKYDLYVDGVLKMASISKYSGYVSTYVQYITFSADGDARGDYFVDNVYSPAGTMQAMLASVDSGLTSPTGNYRWMDVANQTYSSSYTTSYNYSQASVTVNYNRVGKTLTGKLIAHNLKPNFAYQFKLAGTPGTADNELIGLAGRWWQEEWNGTAWTNGQNLNDKGTGSSPNPNDDTYLARKSITDITSPTGLHYRYTGYLLFGYFITNSNGDATLYFETGGCYHVLWQTTQRSRVAEDGPLKTVTFDPVLSAAYDVDYPSSTVSIFGEWERLPMGNVNLAAGNYNCQIVLTEESFHGTGPLEGNWAAAMGTNLSFSILA